MNHYSNGFCRRNLTWFNTASWAHDMVECPNSSIFHKGVPFLQNPAITNLVICMLNWSLSKEGKRMSSCSAAVLVSFSALHWQPAWRGHCTHPWIAQFPQQKQEALAGLEVNTWTLGLESYSPWPKAEIDLVTCTQFSFVFFFNFPELESWPPLMGPSLLPSPDIFTPSHPNCSSELPPSPQFHLVQADICFLCYASVWVKCHSQISLCWGKHLRPCS